MSKYGKYLLGASIPLAAIGGYGLHGFLDTDTDTDTRETVDFRGGIPVKQE